MTEHGNEMIESTARPPAAATQPDVPAASASMLSGFQRISSAVVVATCLFATLWLGGITATGFVVATVGVCLAVMIRTLAPIPQSKLLARRTTLWFLIWLLVAGSMVGRIAPYYMEHFFGIGERFIKLAGMSRTPDETLIWIAWFTAGWACVWLGMRMSFGCIRLVLYALTAMCCFQVIYGLYAFSTGTEEILGIGFRSFTDVPTGTFGNPNHYAGYIAMTMPLAITSVILWLEDRQFRFSALAAFALVSPLALLAAGTSLSRLGLVVCIVSLTALLWLRQAVSEKRNRASRFVAIAMPVILAVLVMSWFGIQEVAERFAALPNDLSRIVVWTSTLRLGAVDWLVGIGGGGFENAFRAVQPIELPKRYVHMHSDPLEFVLENGVLICAALAVLFALMWRRWKLRDTGPVQLAAAAGCIAVVMQSFGDFDLQLPGIFLTFWVLVGIVLNEHKDGRPRRRLARPLADPGRRVLASPSRKAKALAAQSAGPDADASVGSPNDA